MIFMPHHCIIRNVKMVGEGIVAVTAESGELAFFKHNPQAEPVKSQANILMVPEDEEMDASHSSGKD
jgi:hypothetical protein